MQCPAHITNSRKNKDHHATIIPNGRELIRYIATNNAEIIEEKFDSNEYDELRNASIQCSVFTSSYITITGKVFLL